jgi:hypothetical protein
MSASRFHVLDALALVPAYLYWHYAKATRQIWRQAGIFSWFLWHFFSVGLLTKTLFSPWWREGEAVHLSFFGGPAKWGEFVSSVVVNSIITIFGVIVRGIVISIGLVAQVLLWFLACLFFILWSILPALLLYCLVAGIVFVGRPM